MGTIPTASLYNWAMNEQSFRRGTQTLRGSHDIISTEPVQVGHDRQLLMDFHVVEDLNNARRRVHPPARHPENPVITMEALEGKAMPYGGTVLQDGDTGRLRMWLSLGDLRQTGAAQYGCCCESDDGLLWHAADQEPSSRRGVKADAAALDSTRTTPGSVLLLPERMHDRGRYGMCYANYLTKEQIPHPETMHHMRYFTAFSEDGIHWTDAPENPVWVGRNDGTNSIVYNAERDVFMIYRRSTINAGEIRRIAYSESRDLISWTQPVTVITRDELDPLFLYAMPVSYYHGVYLGFLYRLDWHPDYEQNRMLDNGKDFKMDTELVWSRDGVNWQRHLQRPAFLPLSSPSMGAYDWAFATGMNNIIERDDEILIYYGGREYLHKPGARIDEDPLRSHICLATLRRDRFVSVGTRPDGGYMLTRPLAYPGGRLHINAETAPDGFIRVAVREARGVRDGEWPEDWRFDKSVPFSGDSIDHTMAWQGDNTLEAFPDKMLRLHFWIENADLYSFWFE